MQVETLTRGSQPGDIGGIGGRRPPRARAGREDLKRVGAQFRRLQPRIFQRFRSRSVDSDSQICNRSNDAVDGLRNPDGALARRSGFTPCVRRISAYPAGGGNRDRAGSDFSRQASALMRYLPIGRARRLRAGTVGAGAVSSARLIASSATRDITL